MERRRDGFTLTTDPARVDLDRFRARDHGSRATFAYLGDVFVLEPWRGRGLSKWLVETIVADAELQGLRRWSLLTRDAHPLYARVGFTPLASPDRWMERWTPDAYTAP